LLIKICNAVDRTFYDAINLDELVKTSPLILTIKYSSVNV